ncbi:dihydroxyacetone kinase subunit DhaK [Halobacillus litoralis]|uniref:phosphoenolpyruvate--glycerone phosphotransferase n=1 Tax=Halobacillus litoralis TaxID=45668 RepID=A0A410MFF0_9BACI|nr:dihydroxyacetone kinase subunit DhaK [Halobacillus litoralis]QAS53459.1 dihydroxyacetone kinase subunit DhaK [Halobacillus litoralis]
MKKIVNDPEYVVRDMLEGLIAAHPDTLKQIPETTVVARKDAPIDNKVGIVSGGGSGHEPAHAGYIGDGMLDAAVCGEVFTSPTPDQVLEGIKAADGGAGVFLIIKNYTGDVMNFDMAAEMAEAEGIDVEKVVVNDDVAVEDSASTTGRRGIAGTIFVHKIAGAKAAAGGSLQEVKDIAEKVTGNVRSMGMALTPCTVPAAGEPSFSLNEDEMEIGIGIHGESGIEKKEVTSANEIAEELTNNVLEDIEFNHGDDVALIVNGMGATPEMELYILNKKVNEILVERGLNIYKTLVGNYMTALEMSGCSVTLLKLDEEMKSLLDAESSAPAYNI